MSLTTALDDRTSRTRAFITDAAPQLALAGTRGTAGREAAIALGFNEIRDAELVVPMPAGVHKATHGMLVGTAFDYRARFEIAPIDLSETVASRWLLKLRTTAAPDQLARFERRLTGVFALAERLYERGDAESWDRASVLLAWCEQVSRAGVRALEGSLGQLLEQARSAGEVLAAIPSSVLEDLAALRTANRELLALWRMRVQGGRSSIMNPHFPGSLYVGGADGDWIIDHGLVECKTSEKNDFTSLREWLLQAVGYAILDTFNQYQLVQVGLWLPRFARYHAWSIEDLLGGPGELEERQGEFPSIF